jgi:hypothetical protein
MSRGLFLSVVQSAVLLLVAATGPVAAQGATSFDEKGLHGHWVSVGGCEEQPGPGETKSFFHREYWFEPGGAWRMVRTIHGDQACRSPMLTLRLAGKHYSFGPASDKVPGAREAELRFDDFRVTLGNDKAAPMLKGCGVAPWKVGEEQDVAATGCPGLRFKPLAACGVDHDIVQIKDGVLYPGVRTPDMCTPEGRPEALQPTGVARQGTQL